MCTIAPISAAPTPAAPTTPDPSTNGGGGQISNTGVPIPGVLQPQGSVAGVNGGGPAASTPELQAALEKLWGAIGALNGALQALQGVSGGGGTTGCGCMQANAGAAQVDGGGANAAPEAPAASRPDPAPAAPPAPPAGVAPAGFKLQHPLEGAKLTSHYGEVSSIRNNRPHSGTDYAKPSGTPIKAAAPGKILDVGFESGGLGNYVFIDHGNGWVTKYGHMVEKSPLKKGDVVGAGDVIGKVGSTGNSTGPHLHFMVVKDGKNQNPHEFISGGRTF